MVKFFDGAAFGAVSAKQHSIAMAATDSEGMSATAAGCSITSTRGVLSFLGVPQVLPTVLFCDNDAIVKIAKSVSSMKKSLWMRRRVAHLQEQVARLELSVMAVGGVNNVADVYTKYVSLKWFRLAMSVVVGARFDKLYRDDATDVSWA